MIHGEYVRLQTLSQLLNATQLPKLQYGFC